MERKMYLREESDLNKLICGTKSILDPIGYTLDISNLKFLPKESKIPTASTLNSWNIQITQKVRFFYENIII